MGASTNENGYYRVKVPAARDYVVEVWGGDRGYITGYYAHGRTVTERHKAARLDLTRSDQENINLRLSSGRTISGTVSGLEVGERLWLNTWSERTHSGNGTEVVGTGGDAPFEINGLTLSNDHELNWWHHKYTSGFYGGAVNGSCSVESSGESWDDRTLINTQSGNQSNCHISLTTGGTVSGTVAGLQQGHRAYLNIWAEDGDGYGWAELVGDADTASADSFSIEGLKSGSSYILDVWPDWGTTGETDYKGGFYSVDNGTASLSHWENKTSISVSSGGETQLMEFSMISTAGKITGSITGLEQGDRAWVDAYSERTGAWAGTDVEGTDATDSYTLKGLDPASDYRINIWVEGKAGGFYAGDGEDLTNRWEEAALVAVTSNGPDAVANLAITQGISISGTVTGLKSGEIGWVDAFDEGIMFGRGTGINGIDDEGTAVSYTIEGLKANSNGESNGYRLMADAPGYQTLFWNNSGGTTPATWENATLLKLSDATENLNFELSTGRSISGTVSGFNRRDWVFVDAWSPSTGHMGFADIRKYTEAGEENITCDADGTNCSGGYLIEGLPDASDYIVGVDREGMRLFYSDGGAVPFPDSATPLDLRSGDLSGKDLSLTVTTYMISGSVSGVSSGEKVRINAWDPQGAFGWSEVRGEGSAPVSFTISNLPAGNYNIEAWAEGYPALFWDASGSVVVLDHGQSNRMQVDANTADGSDTVSGVLFNFATTTTHSITGTVQDSNGTGINGQLVGAYSALQGVYDTTITNKDGLFVFPALPEAADYLIEAWTAEGNLQVTDVSNVKADKTLDSVLKPASSGITDLVVTVSTSTDSDGLSLIGLFDSNDQFISGGITTGGQFTFKGITIGPDYTVKIDTNIDRTYDQEEPITDLSSGETVNF